MFKFDSRKELLDLDLSFRISEDSYYRLRSFVESYFSDFGKITPNRLTSYNTLNINFNVDDEYCCFSLHHDCLLIRKVELPMDKRGRGYFGAFLESLELLLPRLGVKSICFENIQNPRLCKFLLNNGYSKAYFNYPIPENEDDFDLPEAYKVLK